MRPGETEQKILLGAALVTKTRQCCGLELAASVWSRAGKGRRPVAIEAEPRPREAEECGRWG